MEERRITVLLEDAKEWYNSGNADLKKIALNAFTKYELLGVKEYENIKTFDDACEALNIETILRITGIESDNELFEHLLAIYKIDIIRRALNKDWDLSFTSGSIFYPLIKFYNNYKDAEAELSYRGTRLCGRVEIEGVTFYVVGGNYIASRLGITGLSHNYGENQANYGLLCCESDEVACHMSRYFAKEIFDACYAQYKNYRWLEVCR